MHPAFNVFPIFLHGSLSIRNGADHRSAGTAHQRKKLLFIDGTGWRRTFAKQVFLIQPLHECGQFRQPPSAFKIFGYLCDDIDKKHKEEQKGDHAGGSTGYPQEECRCGRTAELYYDLTQPIR